MAAALAEVPVLVWHVAVVVAVKPMAVLATGRSMALAYALHAIVWEVHINVGQAPKKSMRIFILKAKHTCGGKKPPDMPLSN